MIYGVEWVRTLERALPLYVPYLPCDPNISNDPRGGRQRQAHPIPINLSKFYTFPVYALTSPGSNVGYVLHMQTFTPVELCFNPFQAGSRRRHISADEHGQPSPESYAPSPIKYGTNAISQSNLIVIRTVGATGPLGTTSTFVPRMARASFHPFSDVVRNPILEALDELFRGVMRRLWRPNCGTHSST